jgi:hypothetical protein
MPEFKRDKRVFRAFHSSDDDATDILMAEYDAAFPDMPADKRAEVLDQTTEAVLAAQTQNSWFLISPERQIQLVPALAMALAYEDVENDVWYEVQHERVNQMTLHGYTPEHDDEHGGDHLIGIAQGYLSLPEVALGAPLESREVRRRVIKAIATLVATVELIDRAEASALVGILEEETGLPDGLEDTEAFNMEEPS